MGESDKGVLGLLLGGLLYAIVKLGDEFAIIFGDVLRVLDESFFLRMSIDEIWQAVVEIELSIETIILGLLTIFLVLAIIDYISSEF